MAPAKAEERVTNFQQNINRQAVCVGCGSLIQDQFILKVAPDMEWHASCLKCSECNQYLDESCTCFVRDGRTYCKRDYIRLFASKCSKCHQGFVKSDFVMRAKTDMYHMECFSCVACNRQLIPGDEFAVKDTRLLCRDDSCALLEDTFQHKKMETEPFPCKPDSDTRSQCDKEEDIDEGCNSADEMDDIETITVGRSERSGNNKSGSGRQANKPTRVRTVLTEKQLHTLRACYGANPRPDALMKEQLVEMTGLPPRVIRVWFQNKRCKDKKRSILMSKLQDKQHTNRMGQTLQGIPMVATSPVRHESPTHINQIEVHSFQTPWKGMDSYMHNDMTHPPAFQQLIHSFDKDPELYSSPESDTYSYMTLGSCSENLSPNPPGSVSSGFSGSPLDLSPISQ